jgi:hypothetical protein
MQAANAFIVPRWWCHSSEAHFTSVFEACFTGDNTSLLSLTPVKQRDVQGFYSASPVLVRLAGVVTSEARLASVTYVCEANASAMWL